MAITGKTSKIMNNLIEALKNETDESVIKRLTTAAWEELELLIPNKNTFRKTRNELRKNILAAFPNIETEKPGYYFTEAGKGLGRRYEHLALWYATTNKERWAVEGDEAREKYFAKFPPVSQSQVPNTPEETKIVETKLEDLTVENLELDTETQGIVEDALQQSGMSLADFMKQACKVYAKTVTGKVRKHGEDLSMIETEVLRNDKSFSTHPGRAEELVRRAIQAVKIHNGLATELSQKWMITQSLLVDMTGAKATSVKTIMEKFPELNDYNQVLKDAGATSLLNRKGEIKEEFCGSWSKLVPSGIDE